MARLRTNTLVATGATVFVLLSAYGLTTPGMPGVLRADPAHFPLSRNYFSPKPHTRDG